MKKWSVHLVIFSLIFGAVFLSGCVSETGSPAPGSVHGTNPPDSAAPETIIQETHQADSEDIPEYLVSFTEGKNYMDEGRYEEAIAAFDAALRSNSSCTDAYYNRGMCSYLMGRTYFYEGKDLEFYQNAVDDFSTVLRSNPSHEDALTMRGWSNFWIGYYYFDKMYDPDATVFSYFDSGIRDTNRALEINPKNTDALNARALNSIFRGWGSVASNEFHNEALIENGKKDADYSLKLNPDNPWAHYALARYYFSKYGYSLMDAEYSQAIEQDPDEPLFYLWKGIANLRIDKQIAIDQFDKAIELNPRYAVAYNNRAATLSFLKTDDEKVLSGYNTAIEIDPTVSKYYQNYAFALWNLKYWDNNVQDDVLRLLDKALELDPTNYHIHGDKALILIYLNRNHESTQEILEFQKHAKTNEDFEYAQAILAYNGAEPWYFTYI